MVPAGEFAEVFASMISTAPEQGKSAPVAGTTGTHTEATAAEDISASTGQLGIHPSQPSFLEQKLADIGVSETLLSAPTTGHASNVVNGRGPRPVLSGAKTEPGAESDSTSAAGSVVTAAGSEAPADFPSPVSGETAPGAVVRSPLPVADAPMLTLQLHGAAEDPGAGPLAVALEPNAVIQLPEGGNSLPVAATSGAAVPETDQPVVGSSQAPTAPTVSAVSESAATAVPLAGGTTAVEPAKVPAAAAMPVPLEIAEEAPTGDAATAMPGTNSAPVAATATAPSIPAVPGQTEQRIAAIDPLASARPSTDTGVAAVEPLGAAPAESPLPRTQAPAPLHRQLLGPIATLAAGPHGERTMSVNIAPEALGPITVKAVLGGEGIRMELSAPTDAGREALRAMLPELRRELAAGGSGTITLSAGSDSAAASGGHGGSQGAGAGDARLFAATAAPGLRTRDEQAPEPQDQVTSTALHETSHLDVMA